MGGRERFIREQSKKRQKKKNFNEQVVCLFGPRATTTFGFNKRTTTHWLRFISSRPLWGYCWLVISELLKILNSLRLRTLGIASIIIKGYRVSCCCWHCVVCKWRMWMWPRQAEIHQKSTWLESSKRERARRVGGDSTATLKLYRRKSFNNRLTLPAVPRHPIEKEPIHTHRVEMKLLGCARCGWISLTSLSLSTQACCFFFSGSSNCLLLALLPFGSTCREWSQKKNERWRKTLLFALFCCYFSWSNEEKKSWETRQLAFSFFVCMLCVVVFLFLSFKRFPRAICARKWTLKMSLSVAGLRFMECDEVKWKGERCR